MKHHPIILTNLSVFATAPWLGSALPAKTSMNLDKVGNNDVTAEALAIPQVLSFRDALFSLFPGTPAMEVDVGINGPSDVLFNTPRTITKESSPQLEADLDPELQETTDPEGIHEMDHGHERVKKHKHPRQESSSSDGSDVEEDDEVLYLCSAPDFDTSCGDACACLSLPVSTAPIAYGGKPPCAPIPDTLRPGPPQGVSSARAYSKWECTLFADANCDDTNPDNMFRIMPGEEGNVTLGVFDDKAMSYRCGKIE